MPDRTNVDDELRLLSDEIAERLGGVLTVQLVELAALLAPARNVRAIPAQRFAAGSITLSAANLPMHKVIGKREDAARLRLFFHGASTSAQCDVIRVAQSPEAVQASTFTSALLNGTIRELVLEVNECDVWLGLGADAAAAAGPLCVSWVLEEFDPIGTIEHR